MNGVRVGFDDMTGYIPMANVHGDRKVQQAEHFKINVPWSIYGILKEQGS